ncbi:MAG: hypothetical protein ACUVQP_03960 [Bacteroidales bacterium]
MLLESKTFYKSERKEIAEFIKDMGRSYLLQNQKKEIAQDYGIAKEVKNGEFLVKVKSYNAYFKVKIFSKDRKGLFSFFCGVLFLNGADIVKAEVNTFKGVAIDVFIVNKIFGEDFLDHAGRIGSMGRLPKFAFEKVSI